MSVPTHPKIYHIVHVDRLDSILSSNKLLCDAEVIKQKLAGTTVGMNTVKHRRLNELTLYSHPGLYVGQCVPFYFCFRSIMLYVIHKADNEELVYKGGQGPIIHLQADLYTAVQWAQQQGLRWAFTLSNAGSRFFQDRKDLKQLDELDWDAINARQWQNCKDGKQAEFLMERSFSWPQIERIVVQSQSICQQVNKVLQGSAHRPPVEIDPGWYY